MEPRWPPRMEWRCTQPWQISMMLAVMSGYSHSMKFESCLTGSFIACIFGILFHSTQDWTIAKQYFKFSGTHLSTFYPLHFIQHDFHLIYSNRSLSWISHIFVAKGLYFESKWASESHNKFVLGYNRFHLKWGRNLTARAIHLSQCSNIINDINSISKFINLLEISRS